jgi:hypothetical protein
MGDSAENSPAIFIRGGEPWLMSYCCCKRHNRAQLTATCSSTRGSLPAHVSCAPDHPAMVREALAAHLRRTAALAPGVEHLDPLRVDDAEDRRSGHEDLRPGVMRRAKTQEPGPRGEAGNQRPRVTRHPARAGPVARACAGMQPPQGDHRTGPEVRLRMCGEGAPLLIDLRAHGGEKLHGDYAARLSWEGGHVPAWTRRRTTASPTNVSYEFATFSRHCVVYQRLTLDVCFRNTPPVVT